MKVLLLNGSTRKHGCTDLALSQVAKPLQNVAFGPTLDLLERDSEGLQTMRNLGRSTAGRNTPYGGGGPLDQLQSVRAAA